MHNPQHGTFPLLPDTSSAVSSHGLNYILVMRAAARMAPRHLPRLPEPSANPCWAPVQVLRIPHKPAPAASEDQCCEKQRNSEKKPTQSAGTSWPPSRLRGGQIEATRTQPATPRFSLCWGPPPQPLASQGRSKKDLVDLETEFLGSREAKQDAQADSTGQEQTRDKKQDLLTLCLPLSLPLAHY